MASNSNNNIHSITVFFANGVLPAQLSASVVNITIVSPTSLRIDVVGNPAGGAPLAPAVQVFNAGPSNVSASVASALNAPAQPPPPYSAAPAVSANTTAVHAPNPPVSPAATPTGTQLQIAAVPAPTQPIGPVSPPSILNTRVIARPQKRMPSVQRTYGGVRQTPARLLMGILLPQLSSLKRSRPDDDDEEEEASISGTDPLYGGWSEPSFKRTRVY